MTAQSKSKFQEWREKRTPLQHVLLQSNRNGRGHNLHDFLIIGEYNEDILRQLYPSLAYESAKNPFDFVEADTQKAQQLKNDGYRVVFDDFLTLKTHQDYDIILMRLCTCNAKAYFERALEMQQYGGAVLCFLHFDDLSFELDQYFKSVGAKVEEYDPDTLLISVWKPNCTPPSLILQYLRQNDWLDSMEGKQLAPADVFEAIVRQYEREVEVGVRLIREVDSLTPNLQREFGDKHDHPIMELADKEIYSSVSKITVNAFIRQVRRKYWYVLFGIQKITNFFTSDLQQEYRDRVESLVEYDFNLYHIELIYASMVARTRESIDATIDKLFDRFSQKHSYDERSERNRHYFDGWKTNKAWYIGEKVIIPLNCYKSYSSSFSAYNQIDELRDIERVFDFLDNGTTMSEIDLDDLLKEAVARNQQKDIQLKYFTITVYKKGTCHIRFTNPDLLKKFNIFGSRRRGWLPPSYGYKSYEGMDKEEQAVVDAFEGRDSYRQTMASADYFLETQTLIPVLPEHFSMTVETEE